MKFVKFTITPLNTYSLQTPLDMFRYDGCYPASQRAVSHFICLGIDPDADLKLKIEMIAPAQSVRWEPTYDRWRSFGWNAKITKGF